ncbi:TetR/AcrR family transcriptional regulator [Amycolatopsis sp. AA4]|uniref:TetR/AcrR family transcriptional regulator n=1 Tax=Actinomycetes TaxID=1760 RepID=UPI0001DEE192|nr:MULTISPECIES: TetR/AcrR family transcriptional regulator [Actinomycetes]ATY09108.1 TetR/AcrR family transcriptional regulator [Amycolatopsis sp. AA4]EFL04396.1 TetR family transcriptional regulator [Streptomyces sp. AA4]
MPRPPRYDETLLLDTALEIAAASGPAAVTMSAVARACGAPSGSLYHRFPQRLALQAELWLRTVERFQDGYFAALGSDPDPLKAGAAAARHVVAWSRLNPQEAAVLLHGPQAFGRDEWTDEHARRGEDGNKRVLGAVAELAKRVGADTEMDLDRVVLALVELPLAMVRRYRRNGQPLPAHAEDLAERCARDLLA